MTTATKTKSLGHCLDCGKPLRPAKTSKADYPGTVVRQGRGLCSRDYKKRRMSGTIEAIPLLQTVKLNSIEVEPLTAERIARMQQDAIDWHRGWRKRNGRDHTAPIDLRQIIRTAA